MEYELNNSYEYFEIMQKNSDYYISQLLENISYIKELTESKYNLIVEQFIIYIKSGHNYVENDYIKEIQINNSKCLDTFTNLNNNISKYLNISNLTELEDYIYNNCSVEIIFDSLMHKFNFLIDFVSKLSSNKFLSISSLIIIYLFSKIISFFS